MGVLGGVWEVWEGVGALRCRFTALCLCISLLPATVVVVKLKDAPILCRTDEVGELCVHSLASASSYYRLQGRTTHTFQVSWKRGHTPIAVLQWLPSAALCGCGARLLVAVCWIIL